MENNKTISEILNNLTQSANYPQYVMNYILNSTLENALLINNFNTTIMPTTISNTTIATTTSTTTSSNIIRYTNPNNNMGLHPVLGAIYYNNNNHNHNNNNNQSIFDINKLHLEHAPQQTNSGVIKVYVLSIMAILSLIGNILTMWNIFKTRISRRNSRHSWSAIYALIFHLSIADVMVSGFCIIGEAVWYYTVQWIADDITCKLVKFFQMFSLYVSTYVLVLIGIDRCIAVKYPMRSLNMAKRCYGLLTSIYVLSFFLSLPQV